MNYVKFHTQSDIDHSAFLWCATQSYPCRVACRSQKQQISF